MPHIHHHPQAPGNKLHYPGIPGYHGALWYGMVSVVVVLVLIYALLAGLTLALCGLETSVVEIRCTTGSAKQQYVPTKSESGGILMTISTGNERRPF